MTRSCKELWKHFRYVDLEVTLGNQTGGKKYKMRPFFNRLGLRKLWVTSSVEGGKRIKFWVKMELSGGMEWEKKKSGPRK